MTATAAASSSYRLISKLTNNIFISRHIAGICEVIDLANCCDDTILPEPFCDQE